MGPVSLVEAVEVDADGADDVGTNATIRQER
jgi:hypothetical protein